MIWEHCDDDEDSDGKLVLVCKEHNMAEWVLWDMMVHRDDKTPHAPTFPTNAETPAPDNADRQTTTPHAASEFQMIMNALNGLKTELTAKIEAVNARVDIATIPSSQPFADYGDFSLGNPQDAWFNGNPDPALDAAMTAAEEANLTVYNAGLDRQKVYRTIANELIDQKLMIPMADDAQLERFYEVCEGMFKPMGWSTANAITEDQRTSILASWRRAEAKEDVMRFNYETRHIYQRLCGESLMRTAKISTTSPTTTTPSARKTRLTRTSGSQKNPTNFSVHSVEW